MQIYFCFVMKFVIFEHKISATLSDADLYPVSCILYPVAPTPLHQVS